MNNSLKTNHIGLANNSVSQADKFYRDILGLEKLYEFSISRDLALKIFGLDSELKVIMYGNENLNIELLIDDKLSKISGDINHLCIEIENRDEFLIKCSNENIPVNVIDRGDRVTVFVNDFFGNIFEVKELASSLK